MKGKRQRDRERREEAEGTLQRGVTEDQRDRGKERMREKGEKNSG
jgi:hypothetical protein